MTDYKKIDLDKLFSKNNIDRFSESCIVKAALGGSMGYITGNIFGILFTNLSGSSLSNKISIKSYFKNIRKTAHNTGINIGKFTFLYNGVECAIEKYRGKSDIISSVMTGCGTGSLISINKGPKSILLSCIGLSAFSTALDYYGSV